MCCLSVPALGSGLLHSGVAAALVLSPLRLWLSGPAIALSELFLQFLHWSLAQGQPQSRDSHELSSDFFLPVFAQQENVSAGASTAGTLPVHREAGKELSRTGKQQFFVSFPCTSLGWEVIPLSLSILAGVKKGLELEGAGSGSPFAVFSGSSHSVVSLFLTSPRGQAGSLLQGRGGSRGDCDRERWSHVGFEHVRMKATPCESPGLRRAALSAPVPGNVSGEHQGGFSSERTSLHFPLHPSPPLTPALHTLLILPLLHSSSPARRSPAFLAALRNKPQVEAIISTLPVCHCDIF